MPVELETERVIAADAVPVFLPSSFGMSGPPESAFLVSFSTCDT